MQVINLIIGILATLAGVVVLVLGCIQINDSLHKKNLAQFFNGFIGLILGLTCIVSGVILLYGYPITLPTHPPEWYRVPRHP